jgi:general secretion pathway protein A
MYLDYYHFPHDPFQFPSDPESIFSSSSHLEALATVTFGVVQRKGFLTVLGEPGLGKTTLLQAFVKDPDHKNLKKIHLPHSRVSFPQLLQDIALGLELPMKTDEPSGLLRQLYQALNKEYEIGNNVVLLIDEAQDMPLETLENLRMISNLETPSEKIVQIVLIGQPDFWEILSRHELRQLKQRIPVRVNLFPLSPAESRDYIRFRIEKAGGQIDTVFSEKAWKRIIRQGGGVPEKINQLCREALMAGYEHSCRTVTQKEVKKPAGALRGAPAWPVRKWAGLSLAALLMAGGLYRVVTHLDFSNNPPTTLDQDFLEPTGLKEPMAAKGQERVVSLPSTSGRPDDRKEAKTLPGYPLPGTTPENPGNVSAPKSDPEKTRSVKPSAAGEDKPSIEAKGKAQPSQAAENRSPASPAKKKKNEAVIKRVKKGDNFILMVREVYGASDQALLDYVMKNNPRIKDFKRIREGDKIIFPKRKK